MTVPATDTLIQIGGGIGTLAGALWIAFKQRQSTIAAKKSATDSAVIKEQVKNELVAPGNGGGITLRALVIEAAEHARLTREDTSRLADRLTRVERDINELRNSAVAAATAAAAAATSAATAASNVAALATAAASIATTAANAQTKELGK